MLSRAARPAITLARTANQQQAGMATLKEIEQRCVDSFGRRDRGDARSGDGALAGWGSGRAGNEGGMVESVLISVTG